MSIARPRRRGMALAALGLGGLSLGCTDDPRPAPVAIIRPSTWHVRKVEAPVGEPPAGLGVSLDGAPGYLRATLIVERPADPVAGTASRSALYDSLFPVGPEAKVRVEVTPPVPSATNPRVTFRVESDGIASTTFVEPRVPFFEPGAVVRWASDVDDGQGLADGVETAIGHWTVTAGNGVTHLVIRVLGSRRPIGPRLKGLGSPLGTLID